VHSRVEVGVTRLTLVCDEGHILEIQTNSTIAHELTGAPMLSQSANGRRI